MPQRGEATRVLSELGRGDASAAQRLLPLVYEELRALAGAHFRRQEADHTLQPTALVHEAFLRLSNKSNVEWVDRNHFMAMAAGAMRRVLADHARRRNTLKRGEKWHRLTLNEMSAEARDRDVDVIDLDEALTKLADLHVRKARVIELRFFGGLTNEEVASVLNVSRKTVVQDWTVARLWLRRELSGGVT